jgi:hypothetical protein
MQFLLLARRTVEGWIDVAMPSNRRHRASGTYRLRCVSVTIAIATPAKSEYCLGRLGTKTKWCGSEADSEHQHEIAPAPGTAPERGRRLLRLYGLSGSCAQSPPGGRCRDNLGRGSGASAMRSITAGPAVILLAEV